MLLIAPSTKHFYNSETVNRWLILLDSLADASLRPGARFTKSPLSLSGRPAPKSQATTAERATHAHR